MTAIFCRRLLRGAAFGIVGGLLGLYVIAAIMPSRVSAQASTQTVVVQPGETLYHIALRYGVTVDALVVANNLIDPSHIYAGEVLIIPGTNAAALPAVVANGQAGPTYAVNYIVQVGDTMSHIARQYGVTPGAIIAANNLIDANHIEVGQALLIPGVSSAGSGAATAPPTPVVLPPTVMPPAATRTAVTPTPVPMVTRAAPATITAAAPLPTQTVNNYTVQAGEDLAAIARKYNLNWADIAALNNLADPNVIYAGMVLRIPANAIASAPAVPVNSVGNAVIPDPLANKQIVIVLHEERFYAYENGVLVRDVLVSTGLPMTPTVTGTFHIYVKYAAQLMVGPDYYLPNVPWISYFYEGYALHGTYWHHNWGHEMSHGCVNMPTDEAKWVYDWAPVGTTVTVVE